MSALGDSVKLPSGLVLPNRLVSRYDHAPLPISSSTHTDLTQAAMAEMLTGFSHTPTPSLINVYSQWAKGNWGGLLQVGPPFNLISRGCCWMRVWGRKRHSWC
ncbi:hypothetical protein BJX76DRAFT_330968 [Aspergillus varians]